MGQILYLTTGAPFLGACEGEDGADAQTPLRAYSLAGARAKVREAYEGEDLALLGDILVQTYGLESFLLTVVFDDPAVPPALLRFIPDKDDLQACHDELKLQKAILARQSAQSRALENLGGIDALSVDLEQLRVALQDASDSIDPSDDEEVAYEDALEVVRRLCSAATEDAKRLSPLAVPPLAFSELQKAVLALCTQGLTFSDCLHIFGVDRDTSPLATQALAQYGQEGAIEIDDMTVLSPGEGGAYVLGWLWVADTDVSEL